MGCGIKAIVLKFTRIVLNGISCINRRHPAGYVLMKQIITRWSRELLGALTLSTIGKGSPLIRPSQRIAFQGGRVICGGELSTKLITPIRAGGSILKLI